MMRAARAALLLFFLTALATPTSASAQEVDEAVKLYEQGEAMYRAGKFAEAAALLERAYAIRPDPVLLYNAGRAYEGLGDHPRAIAAYQRYLQEETDVPDRAGIEARIASMKAEIERRRALERAAARAATERTTTAGPWPWVVAGAGGAVLIGAGAFGLLSRARNSDLAEADQQSAERLHDQAQTFATVANIGFVAGSVLVVVGVTWGLLNGSKKASAAPPVAGSGALFLF